MIIISVQFDKSLPNCIRLIFFCYWKSNETECFQT